MTTVIIGAGIGGLAAAIALAAQGEEVTVLERQSGAGGKLLPVQLGDQVLDSGPTVMTMRWVFDELFAKAGDNFDAHISLKPLDVLARHYWSGGQALDLFADQAASFHAIGQFAGVAEAKAYQQFALASQRIHHSLLRPFLKSQRPTPWGLAAAMPIGQMLAINPFETLWHALGRYFSDPRLRQLFGRYATYCGSSPFKAPATLMLVADVEAAGVWRIEGGMGRLAQALENLARYLGVMFHFDCSALRVEVQNSKVHGVIDSHGQQHLCSAVIVNADSAAVTAGLFGQAVGKVLAPNDRSLSAVTWCGLAESIGVPLQHHTIFFSDSYEKEFSDLAHGPANDPTVYICDQGDNRKLVLVNAPANGMGAPADIDRRMLDRLQKSGLHLDLKRSNQMRRSPKEFAELYPATSGALYGRSSHGWMSTFLRPQARTKIPGLYLAGGGTHPGPGVPMAALAGMRAAEALLHDRALMRPFRKTAIAGGTLMG
jgi:1-hydroxycarotenoid 3,4-desaturase